MLVRCGVLCSTQYYVPKKNGPCGQSGQRPADSPISPLFYQAKRTYPDLTFPIFEHHSLIPSMYYYICATYQACLQALKPYGHEQYVVYTFLVLPIYSTLGPPTKTNQSLKSKLFSLEIQFFAIKLPQFYLSFYLYTYLK